MASLANTDLGRIEILADQGVGGIATSGFGGRSLARGIATSVTVLAARAPEADMAATLIANEVDLPGHPGIFRLPADEVQPDSDLGSLLVTRFVPLLSPQEIATALDRGESCAEDFRRRGIIRAAALFLQGESRVIGSLAPAESFLSHV